MKLKMVCVMDIAVGAFGQPFSVRSIGEATRGFMDEVSKSDSQLRLHPEDFSLYDVGEFDQDTGILTGKDVPERICRARDFVFTEE